MLRALGYVGIASPRLDEWRSFATGVIGLQVADHSQKILALRMDDRRQRILIDDSEQRGFFGWEAGSVSDLDALANRLTAAQIPHEPMSRTNCAKRFVAQGLAFADPAGNRIEV